MERKSKILGAGQLLLGLCLYAGASRSAGAQVRWQDHAVLWNFDLLSLEHTHANLCKNRQLAIGGGTASGAGFVPGCAISLNAYDSVEMGAS